MDARLITRGLEKPRRIEVDESTLTSTFGTFTAKPLEKGYGHTIGNSLRRILLSSIPGAAITAVEIEGVEHEFSTVQGVIEDVADIILNLKLIRLKIRGSGTRTLTLEVTGPCEVKASMLQCPDDVEILTPDVRIATIDQPGFQLKLTLTASVGRGFETAEEIKEKQDAAGESRIGLIPVDALYSPVRKVAYRVESTRVRQRTDYDKLVLEVTTDGSITPEDAVGYAARIFTDYLKIFKGDDDLPEMEETAESKEDEQLKKILATPVEELELSVRSSNCLKAANLRTLGELVIRTDSEMLKYRNFGKKSLQEIKEKLEQYGLGLGMKEKTHLVQQILAGENR